MNVSVVVGDVAGDVMPDQHGIRGKRGEDTCKEVCPGELVVEWAYPNPTT